MKGDRGMVFDREETDAIIQAIIQVHRTLGPGFLESVYRKAMVVELRRRGLKVETEKTVPIYYEGVAVGEHRLDLLVADRVIVELKTVEELGKVHYAQLPSYLKATGLKTGLLVNFAKELADFRRVSPP